MSIYYADTSKGYVYFIFDELSERCDKPITDLHFNNIDLVKSIHDLTGSYKIEKRDGKYVIMFSIGYHPYAGQNSYMILTLNSYDRAAQSLYQEVNKDIARNILTYIVK